MQSNEFYDSKIMLQKFTIRFLSVNLHPEKAHSNKPLPFSESRHL